MISRSLFSWATTVGVAWSLCTQMLFAATTADLAIIGSVRFSEEPTYAGQVIRLYVTVRNYGSIDASAKVLFYQGAVLIGKSQPISVIADGGSDDVYVDFTVPEGTFNIRALIQGQDVQDPEMQNNEVLTKLYTAIADKDRDGIADDKDTCPDVSNASNQGDADADGFGDVCDADRDGDGVSNSKDAYPDDPKKSVIERVLAPTTPTTTTSTTTTAVIATPSATAVATPVTSTTPVDSTSSSVAAPSSVNENASSGSGDSSVSGTASSDAQSGDSSSQEPKAYAGIFGVGALHISPYAKFTYRQLDWRTYEFQAVESEGGAVYAWDFGDGATSMQQTITHAFPESGEYTVTLAVTSNNGEVVSDAQVFSVSLFHLRNPWIQGTLGGLFFAALLGLWMMVRFRGSRKEDSSESV